jgi:hypothetical protein
MAIKFFKSIDLTHNELQNAKLHLTGTAPQQDEGKIYFDTGTNTVKVYVDYESATDTWETVAFQSWATGQFDPAGTDNSTNVTLVTTSHDYLSITGQQITLGTIQNDDLQNSSIEVDGTDISLGGSVTTLQLGATSTTALAGDTAVDNVSNANLLTALANLESTNGSGVNENITIGASSGDTIVITGNLTVQGTTTTLNTETVTIEDNIILLNSNVAGSGNGTDAGIEVERGDDTNVSLFWDESESAWTVSNTEGTYAILQSVGGTTFKVNLNVSESSVGRTGNTYTVTHSLGTKDVLVQVVDISDASPTYETVFTENQRPTTNTVTIAFANAVTDGDYRVLISQV